MLKLLLMVDFGERSPLHRFWLTLILEFLNILLCILKLNCYWKYVNVTVAALLSLSVISLTFVISPVSHRRKQSFFFFLSGVSVSLSLLNIDTAGPGHT